MDFSLHTWCFHQIWNIWTTVRWNVTNLSALFQQVNNSGVCHPPQSISKSDLIANVVSVLCYTVDGYSLPPINTWFTTETAFPRCFSSAVFSPRLSLLYRTMFQFLSLGSPSSAAGHCGSGERGSESRENSCVTVCVSWWKPPRHSPVDKGKTSVPSAKDIVSHIVMLSKLAIQIMNHHWV